MPQLIQVAFVFFYSEDTLGHAELAMQTSSNPYCED
jgi:hypothetical protein